MQKDIDLIQQAWVDENECNEISFMPYLSKNQRKKIYRIGRIVAYNTRPIHQEGCWPI